MAVHERAELRDRVHVFRDRAHAGEVVAEMMGELRGSETTVLAVPAGGLPVAAAVAGALGLPLDVAVVSKITLPWNTEVGYGAVAFDGTTRLNDALAADLGLARDVVQRGIEETRAKVARRVAELRGAQPALDLSGRCAVVVDDGLASGFTMGTAVEALRKCGASRLLVAVPTGSLRAVERLAPEVDDLYCANVRGGYPLRRGRRLRGVAGRRRGRGPRDLRAVPPSGVSRTGCVRLRPDQGSDALLRALEPRYPLSLLVTGARLRAQLGHVLLGDVGRNRLEGAVRVLHHHAALGEQLVAALALVAGRGGRSAGSCRRSC